MAIYQPDIQDVFSAYIHEDVEFCSGEDFLGGLQEAEIYFCYLPFVDSLKLPLAAASNALAGTVSAKITCKPNRGFQKMKALVDTSELSSQFSGSKEVSDVSDLKVFLLGVRAQLIGFSRKFRNRPFVFIIKDNNGRQFVLGNLASPAYLKDFNMISGKKFDDDNGVDLTITSNSILYEYTQDIPIVDPKDLAGDFDSDFDIDFD